MAVVGGRRCPAILVHLLIQAGQHDAALGEVGDHFEQVGGRRDRAGRSGGDDRAGGRVGAPCVGLRLQDQIAPLGGVDGAFQLQDGRPDLGQDLQEFQRDLPVLGVFLRHQIGEAVERHAFRMHLIQQPRQFGGQTGGLIGCDALAVLRQDGAAQQQLPAQAGECGGQVERAGQAGDFLQRQAQFVRVDVAERAHARQQLRRSARQAEERFAERAAGAAGRQQDAVLGEGQGAAFGLRAGEDAGRQRVHEGHAGWDGEDLWNRVGHMGHHSPSM